MSTYTHDDIDYGVEKTILTIQHKILEDGEIINPFFVGIDGGNLKQMSYCDIYRNYNSVIILVLDNHDAISNINDFLKETIFENKIKNENFKYFRASINMIRNNYHYYRTNVISKNYLEKLFPDSKFNESELVLTFFEMSEENTRKYCDLYKLTNDISDIKSNIDMIHHYVDDDTTKKYINYESIIKNLHDSDYWENKNNIDINITPAFIEREFNNQSIVAKHRQSVENDKKNINTVQSVQQHANTTATVIKIGTHDGNSSDFEIIDDINVSNESNESNNDEATKNHNESNKNTYDLQIEQTLYNKKNNYIDPSYIIKNTDGKKKRTFFASLTDTMYTNNYMTNLFNRTNDDKIKYDLMNNLLVSKDYCHLIVNNSMLLDNLRPMIDKYKHVFKYTFGYAWLTMYLEECITRTQSTKYSRFVFDIDTASKLPVFPYVYADLKQNPYITILVDDTEIVHNNAFGISYIDNYNDYGVCDLNTFKKRFNIFATRDPQIDPLEGIDWHHFAVTGSCISACLQKKSPLLNEIMKKHNNDENIAFQKFVQMYYDDSDVDLMTNHESIIGFLEAVNGVCNLLKKNLNTYQVIHTTIRKFSVSITEHFFTDFLDDFNKTYNVDITREEFENMTEDIMFKLYIYNKYVIDKNKQLHLSTKNNKLDLKNKFIQEFLIPNSYDSMTIYKVDSINYDNHNQSDSEIIYRRNDLLEDGKQKYSSDKNKIVIKFSESYRFKLKCKNTNIEVFRTRDKDFFSTVARFHFPCVRAYYTGDNVYMLPSCITAMMTGLNIDYKYFSGIRDPNEIINKYLKRGYGLILNKYEILALTEYNKNNNEYIDILGEKTTNHNLYKLNLVEQQKKYSINDLKQYYYKFSNKEIDFTKMKTISDRGDINKYYKSYVEYCYDMCQ